MSESSCASSTLRIVVMFIDDVRMVGLGSKQRQRKQN